MGKNKVYVVEECVEGEWRPFCAFVHEASADQLVIERTAWCGRDDWRVVVYKRGSDGD